MKTLPRMSRTPKTNSIAGLVKSIGPALSFGKQDRPRRSAAKLLTRDMRRAADYRQGGEAAGAVVGAMARERRDYGGVVTKTTISAFVVAIIH